MIDFLQRVGSAVCHQMAERSFLFHGMQMPLCARCTGIYTGVFFAFCFFFGKKRMEAGKPFSLQQAVVTGAAILPVGLDGVGSYLGFWESSQLMRVLTGSLVGAIVPGFLLMAGNFDPKRENRTPIYEKTAEILLLLAGTVFFGLCLWLGLLLPIGAVFSVVGEELLWGGLVWLVLKNLLRASKIPIWKISLAVSFAGLWIIGGLA